jgi:hypothetical protein
VLAKRIAKETSRVDSKMRLQQPLFDQPLASSRCVRPWALDIHTLSGERGRELREGGRNCPVGVFEQKVKTASSGKNRENRASRDELSWYGAGRHS